jgi:hypothetical protein
LVVQLGILKLLLLQMVQLISASIADAVNVHTRVESAACLGVRGVDHRKSTINCKPI